MSVKTGFINVPVRVPTAKYADELLSLKCGTDLIATGFFPNLKEVTESFAAYWAVRRHCKFLKPYDPDVRVVVVGDGHKPRTAATFAFRTAWTIYSIDPALKYSGYIPGVQRVLCMPIKIGSFDIGLNPDLIVLVHSHAPIPSHLKSQAVVSIPCCMPDGWELPHVEYDDWGIWSDLRRVRIWRFSQEPGVASQVAA